MKHQLEENNVLLELAIDENDEEVRNEIECNLEKIVKELEDIEFRHMLNGEHDINNAFVSINSGAGGTEAQDAASAEPGDPTSRPGPAGTLECLAAW